jgi:hypothetical protein
MPGMDTNENGMLAESGRTSNVDVKPRWDTDAPRDENPAAVVDVVALRGVLTREQNCARRR